MHKNNHKPALVNTQHTDSFVTAAAEMWEHSCVGAEFLYAMVAKLVSVQI